MENKVLCFSFAKYFTFVKQRILNFQYTTVGTSSEWNQMMLHFILITKTIMDKKLQLNIKNYPRIPFNLKLCFLSIL